MPSSTTDRPRTPLPTDPDRIPVRRLRLARAGRRGSIALLAIFVAIALVGGFGYRTGTASAAANGYLLDLRYPAVARAGQSIQWMLSIHHDGGLPKTLVVSTTAGYFDTLDFNDIEPQPESATADTEDVIWTFETPPGDDMTITVDALVATQAWRGATAETSVLEGGVPVVTISYTTRIAP
jgi:hypothetical protein